ncbi:MAG TPA: family 43 glycosylhydrolase, partial [Polyangiales bacterium]|nr:family 43 glycosylhydrolase [Polyangiales bacterium]
MASSPATAPSKEEPSRMAPTIPSASGMDSAKTALPAQTGSAGARTAAAAGSPAGGVGGTVGAAGVPSSAGSAGQPPRGGAESTDEGTRDAGAPDAGQPQTDDDLCQVSLSTGQAPMRPQLSGNTFAHDPTMIEADGVYYRFWTGERLPMATSRDLSNWTDGPAVYRNGYPKWSTDWLAGISGQSFNFPWAPDASFFGGKYHIYASFS